MRTTETRRTQTRRTAEDPTLHLRRIERMRRTEPWLRRSALVLLALTAIALFAAPQLALALAIPAIVLYGLAMLLLATLSRSPRDGRPIEASEASPAVIAAAAGAARATTLIWIGSLLVLAAGFVAWSREWSGIGLPVLGVFLAMVLMGLPVWGAAALDSEKHRRDEIDRRATRPN